MDQLRTLRNTIKDLSGRLDAMERSSRNGDIETISRRLKCADSVVAGNVYIITDTELVATTTTAGDTRTVVIALESKSDSIGDGQVFARFAIGGSAWVNYSGSASVNDYAKCGGVAGSVALSATTEAGVFGRVVRVDAANGRVLVFFSKIRQIGTTIIPVTHDCSVTSSFPDLNYNDPYGYNRVQGTNLWNALYRGDSPDYVQPYTWSSIKFYFYGHPDSPLASISSLRIAFLLYGFTETTATHNNSAGINYSLVTVTPGKAILKEQWNFVELISLKAHGFRTDRGIAIYEIASAPNSFFITDRDSDPDHVPYFQLEP